MGIHRSPVNSPHKGHWRGAVMFSLICTWTNGWVNNRDAGDLRRHRAHYDVIVMIHKVQGNRSLALMHAAIDIFPSRFAEYDCQARCENCATISDTCECECTDDYRGIHCQTCEYWWLCEPMIHVLTPAVPNRFKETQICIVFTILRCCR